VRFPGFHADHAARLELIDPIHAMIRVQKRLILHDDWLKCPRSSAIQLA
jgi:hypothetical protein